MSGHNKWAKVKHVKAKTDAIKGRLFTKIIKEITIAARNGGSDPNSNPRLRQALQSAKDANMPKDNVDRAIKKGTGELEGVSYEEVTYEGYGPAGVAVIARCVTDNRNRTVSEIRKIFSKGGGNMGENGCVAWMFENKGYFFLDAEDNPKLTEDALMELAIEANCEDVKVIPGGFEVTCEPGQFESARPMLEGKGLKITEAKLTMKPKNLVKVDSGSASKVMKLLDELGEHDDIQDVYDNADIAEQDLAAAGD